MKLQATEIHDLGFSDSEDELDFEGSAADDERLRADDCYYIGLLLHTTHH